MLGSGAHGLDALSKPANSGRRAATSEASRAWGGRGAGGRYRHARRGGGRPTDRTPLRRRPPLDLASRHRPPRRRRRDTMPPPAPSVVRLSGPSVRRTEAASGAARRRVRHRCGAAPDSRNARRRQLRTRAARLVDRLTRKELILLLSAREQRAVRARVRVGGGRHACGESERLAAAVRAAEANAPRRATRLVATCALPAAALATYCSALFRLLARLDQHDGTGVRSDGGESSTQNGGGDASVPLLLPLPSHGEAPGVAVDSHARHRAIEQRAYVGSGGGSGAGRPRPELRRTRRAARAGRPGREARPLPRGPLPRGPL